MVYAVVEGIIKKAQKLAVRSANTERSSAAAPTLLLTKPVPRSEGWGTYPLPAHLNSPSPDLRHPRKHADLSWLLMVSPIVAQNNNDIKDNNSCNFPIPVVQ